MAGVGVGARVCVVRKYSTKDQAAVQDIMARAIMETVTEYFWAAVLSEVFPQVALLVIAFSYIGLGIPFYFCLLGIPTAIIIIYVVVWSAHMSKVLEMNQELGNIPRLFLQQPNGCFWVAEVMESSEACDLDMLIDKVKKVEYQFMSEDEAIAKTAELEGLKRHVVGMLGVTKSLRGGTRNWLKHLAVKKAYRRRGIAQSLLDEAIQFCTEHCIEGIELITTECHYKHLHGSLVPSMNPQTSITTTVLDKS